MYRIILLDDEPWALSRLADMVRWEDYNLRIAGQYTDPLEALEAVRRDSPDAVITDIRMHRIDGLEFMRRVREFNPHVELLVTSAHSDFHVAQEAMMYDASRYLLKPLDPDEVQSALLRLREKLDAKPGNGLPEFNLECSPGYIPKPIESWLASAGRYADCYLLLCVGEPPELPCGSGTWLAVSFGESGKGMLAALPGQASLPKALSADTGVGISPRHESFANLPLMARQARLSLEHSLRYSDNETIAAIQFYIADNHTRQLTIKEIASEVYLSEIYLSELFKKHTGLTINKFINQIRMNRAVSLLRTTRMSLGEVAVSCGYPNYGYFGRLFKQIYGQTPESFRREG